MPKVGGRRVTHSLFRKKHAVKNRNLMTMITVQKHLFSSEASVARNAKI